MLWYFLSPCLLSSLLSTCLSLTPHLLLVLISPFILPFTSPLCLQLIKISKIQMAAGWLLSGSLPLIITGGEARGNVGGAETNGKLDFFTELEWGGGVDPYIDKPSTGRRSGEVLRTCRRRLRQTGSDAPWHLDMLPAATAGLRWGSNPPSSPGPACGGRTGWRRRRRRRRVKRPQS